jgi:hypothetical protein
VVILAVLAITAPLAFSMGGQQKHVGNLHRLVPDVQQHVPADGNERDVFQDAAVRGIHHPQRPGGVPLDGPDYYHRKGGEKGG